MPARKGVTLARLLQPAYLLGQDMLDLLLPDDLRPMDLQCLSCMNESNVRIIIDHNDFALITTYVPSRNN